MSTTLRDIDERARRTRNRIARAITGLAVRQPLDSITVRQLVGEAGISRSTFYAHFGSLADYLTRSYAWVLQRGAQMSAMQPGGDRLVLPIRAILDHMAANARYVAATLDSGYRPAMNAAGEAALLRVALANLERLRPDLSMTDRQAVGTFLVGGFMGMLSQWKVAGMQEPPESFQRRFEALCKLIVDTEAASGPRLRKAG